jgi:hypothetical protein
MPVRSRYSVASTLAFCFFGITGAAEKPTDDQLKFFETKIRPVLAEKCYSCHSAETKKGPKAGLVLDTRDGIRKGGESGPAVVPGNLKKSILIQALKGIDKVSQMPPNEKLTADVIADFEKWITIGAPDPREGTAVAKKPIDVAAGKNHWAFQPIQAAAVPKGSEWATSDVDRFIEAARNEKGLTPVADADKRTLLRRVYFDLIGLPPTPEQTEAFLKDTSATTFAKVVDELLAQPQFGEKWGRHWLDVARYAESSGKERNMNYPHAWRYRDYVIAAFNTDKPINQFFQEQIAGDLLGGTSETQKAERIIATGFLAIGPKSHAERNVRQFALDVADEQIDAMGQGMLGLTIACARCHDHKFDPIPTKDYYAVAGIFTSTDTKIGVPSILIARNGSSAIALPSGADLPAANGMSSREFEELKKRRDDLKKRRDEAIQEGKKDREPNVKLVALQTQLATVEGTLALYDDSGTTKKLAMGVADKFFPKDMPVQIRGELEKTGEVVPRGYVQVVNGTKPKISHKESGRRELAEWITSTENPLTPRVYVNRIWQHLFGRGLVSSPDNFGTMGQVPTHPALLDFLANRFQADGWSTKKLIRTLVTSHTYQMSSNYHAGHFTTDPDNLNLWRMSKRRLDAEAIRDAMFAVAGELDTTPAGSSPTAKIAGLIQALDRFGINPSTAETKHRSVYIPIIRDNVPESLELFDFAEPSLVSGTRDDTSVPAQGLFLLNNTQVMKLADATSGKLAGRNQNETERVDAAFRLILNRSATKTERDAATKFLFRFKQTEAKTNRKPAELERAAWAALVQALFASAEFRYLD